MTRRLLPICLLVGIIILLMLPLQGCISETNSNKKDEGSKANGITQEGTGKAIVNENIQNDQKGNETMSENEAVVKNTNSEKEYRIFAKPPKGWVGDVMPFFDDGLFQLFYLQDWRDGAEGFHPFHRFSTKNLIDYKYEGEMIPYGVSSDQDLALGTGSVIKVGDTYHGFYTGHNYKFPDAGKPKEAMMHAVSKDMKVWTKVKEDTFYAPEGYELNDFRDPFLLYNEQTKEYWMLVAARKNDLGGVIALFTSKDLKKWKVQKPLYAPEKYFMLECPDLFKLGDYWYLVFSEFSHEKSTHYRMSKSINGPWITPEMDVFDSAGFYAAKTTADNMNRYLFGWIPTKEQQEDSGKWEWAGNMAVHQLYQRKDGTLAAQIPNQYEKYFASEQKFEIDKQIGNVTVDNNGIKIESYNDIAGVISKPVKASMMVTATLKFDKNTDKAGIAFGVNGDLNKAYGIQIDLENNRVSYESAILERIRYVDPTIQVPVKLTVDKEYAIKLVIENDICVLYIDDVALSTRIYKMQNSDWGFYSSNGKVTFKDIKLYVPMEK